MQVNTNMPIAQPVLKGDAAGSQSAEQVALVSKTAADTAGKTEIVTQTLAKMEKEVLQWFFAQRPELGTSLAQLLSLQEQLSKQAAGGTPGAPDNLNTKLVKILDMMNLLLISPENSLTAKDAMTKSPQTLLALIEELDQLKKEQLPELQTKTENLTVKLMNLLKQMSKGGNWPTDSQQVSKNTVASEQLMQEMPVMTTKTENATNNAETVSVLSENKSFGDRQGKEQAMEQTVVPREKPGRGLSDDSELNKTAQKNANNGEAGWDLSETEGFANKQGRGKTIGQTAVPGEKPGTGFSDDPGLNKTTQKNVNIMLRSAAGQATATLESTQEDVFNPAVPLDMQTAGLVFGQAINKATVLQQKMQEVLQQFTEQLNENEVSGGLSKVLQDMVKCIKNLQVNPETQWERLLRYPVLYKQTMHNAMKLLQELINTKSSSDHVQQNAVNLLREITANLHVQNSVNQLRQEDPANQTMYFQIPLQIGDTIKNGEILVVHQREKQGNKWSVVNSWYRFYLETQYLDQVQINLHAANKQLNIQFLLTDAAYTELFNEHKAILTQVLTHYGYDVMDITCSTETVTPFFLLDADSANRQCVDIII